MTDFNLELFVKQHRKNAGLTQLQMTNLAEVGKTIVFVIEKNNQSVRWRNLLAVLKVLNIGLDFISPVHK
jgi:DNA-binding XRE family transcriptional regulator